MPRALLLAALSGCSIGFTGEGLSTSGGDGGLPVDGGAFAGAAVALVTGAGSGETLLIDFDAQGEVAGFRPFFGLPGDDGRTGVVGDAVVSLLDAQQSVTGRALDAPWQSTSFTPGPGARRVAFSGDGAFAGCAPFMVSDRITLAPARDGGVSAFGPTGRLRRARRECAMLAVPGAVLAVAGSTDSDDRLASIEVARVSNNAIGAFAETTPLPEALTDVAATVGDGELFVCGGYRDDLPTRRSDRCWRAALSDQGQVGAFTELARMPVTFQQGHLVRVRNRLHLFQPASSSVNEEHRAIFSLTLSSPAAEWRRSTLELPVSGRAASIARVSP